MKTTSLAQAMKKTAFAVAAGLLLLEVGGSAMAQDYRYMSCEQLWYERNLIYAQKGYCFKTARARAVFGPACFPPYGQLAPWEQRRVEDIRYWERQMGCG